MRNKNLAVFDSLTLQELETILDQHTREEIPIDQWSAFSWSVSRHQTFTQCKRRYYLNYYGARRVRNAIHEAISGVWWLKQVQMLKMWIGSVVHDVAAKAVNAYEEGETVHRETLLNHALETYRGGVGASKRGVRYQKRWIALFQHIYPKDDILLTIEDGEEHTLKLVDAVLSSEAYQGIIAIPPDDILEVDEPFQSFLMNTRSKIGEIKVYAIPDVLVSHDDMIQIIDWKTGSVAYDSLRDQAGVYRYYAHMEYSLPGDHIQVAFSALADDGQNVEAPGGTPSLEETRAMMDESIGEMVNCMSSVEYHTVAIEDFPMTDELTRCQWCNFKRACWQHEETYA